jgi:hypothetical protein
VVQKGIGCGRADRARRGWGETVTGFGAVWVFDNIPTAKRWPSRCKLVFIVELLKPINFHLDDQLTPRRLRHGWEWWSFCYCLLVQILTMPVLVAVKKFI